MVGRPPADRLNGRCNRCPPPRPTGGITCSSSAAGSPACTRRRSSATSRGVTLTLVDRRNFHLFQPLLYQVATGALSPGEIAQPLRSIFRRHKNTTVLLGQAVGLDVVAHEVQMSDGGPIDYDTLVVASGAHFAYFGHDDWARRARV